MMSSHATPAQFSLLFCTLTYNSSLLPLDTLIEKFFFITTFYSVFTTLINSYFYNFKSIFLFKQTKTPIDIS